MTMFCTFRTALGAYTQRLDSEESVVFRQPPRRGRHRREVGMNEVPSAVLLATTGALQFSCSDLLHHLDLEVALRDQRLQPHVLLLELRQPPNVVVLERAEPLLRDVDRLPVHPVALGRRRHRIEIRLPQDPTICSSVNLDLGVLPPG